jgi:hypothetical protein
VFAKVTSGILRYDDSRTIQHLLREPGNFSKLLSGSALHLPWFRGVHAVNQWVSKFRTLKLNVRVQGRSECLRRLLILLLPLLELELAKLSLSVQITKLVGDFIGTGKLLLFNDLLADAVDIGRKFEFVGRFIAKDGVSFHYKSVQHLQLCQVSQQKIHFFLKVQVDVEAL